MNHSLKRFAVTLIGLSLLAVASVKANPVTVTEVGIGANETVYIDSSTLGNNLHVYAGVVDLVVNGVATTGFCIDPWHWSGSGPLSYNSETLGSGPKPPGPMGTATANEIEQLWAQYYTSGISNVNAAALQITIWELVDAAVSGGTFSLVSIDGGTTVSNAVNAEILAMKNFLVANPYAPKASLIAVTGPGQDYVIPGRVPDGGTTVALLGLGLVGLLAVRKKFGVR